MGESEPYKTLNCSPQPIFFILRETMSFGLCMPTMDFIIKSEIAQERNKKYRPYVPHNERSEISIIKRCARERHRTSRLNQGFQNLQQCVPGLKTADKRVAKEKILRYAIDYIQFLDNLLQEDQSSMTFEERMKSYTMSISPESSPAFDGAATEGYSSTSSDDDISNIHHVWAR